jgi:mycothiol synthase
MSQQENARSGRNQGWTDPVGTRPEFRRQGLARALLLTGFHLLRQRGVETAVLGVSSENTARRRALASVGFHKQSTKISFAKQLREH